MKLGEQQAATAEILGVINSSSGELERVFQSILKNTVRICDAKFGSIYRWDGEALHFVSTHNAPLAYAEARRRLAVKIQPGDPMGRLLATKMVFHIEDCAAEPSYAEHHNPAMVVAVEEGGARTGLFVPMLKEPIQRDDANKTQWWVPDRHRVVGPGTSSNTLM